MIIPAVVSAALIGGLFAFADAPRVVTLIARLDPRFLLLFFFAMVVYHAVRALQWLILLRQLKIKVGLRSRIFSYLGGAVSMYLPGGSYFQNYLLYETRDADPAETSAATTVMILTEPLMAMVIIFALGIDHWTILRWALGIGAPVIVAGLVGIIWLLKTRGLPGWLERRKLVRRGREQIDEFIDSLARFRSPRTLALQALVAGVYLLIGGFALWLVELMLRLDAPSLSGCVAAYCFATAAAMFIPLFTDLGSLEVGGVIALIAAGASRYGAVAMMIFDRVLMIAAVFVFLLIAAAIWRDLVKNAFQQGDRRRRPHESEARTQPRRA